MGAVTAKPATYADIEALPPNVVGEILFGRLVTHPWLAPKRAFASSSLGIELSGPFQKGRGDPGIWSIPDEPEVHVGGHVVVPVARMLEVFRLSGKDWIASETDFDDDTVAAAPFDAITFSLGELWDTPVAPDDNPSSTN